MSEFINSTRLEYLDHIEKQKISGLSIKKYCKQNNLIDHKFSYYRTYNLKINKPSIKESAFASIKVKGHLPEESELKPIENLKTATVDPAWLAQFVNNLWGVK